MTGMCGGVRLVSQFFLKIFYKGGVFRCEVSVPEVWLVLRFVYCIDFSRFA